MRTMWPIGIVAAIFLDSAHAHPLLQDKIKELFRLPLPANLHLSRETQGKKFYLRYEPVTPTQTVPVAQLHQWQLYTRPLEQETSIKSLAFFAEMPQHLHGMPTEARIQEIAPGRYEISGLNLTVAKNR